MEQTKRAAVWCDLKGRGGATSGKYKTRWKERNKK
jgi:hypothetical protein